MTDQALVPISSAITLPSSEVLTDQIKAIKAFQDTVHKELIKGQDYGAIPGTGDKETLLKPGAEKIAKILRLADHYDIIEKTEEWTGNGFFRYLVKCRLTSIEHEAQTGQMLVISEGVGECNSKESKYRWRWLMESQLSPGLLAVKDTLYSEIRASKKTGVKYKTYRIESDDVFSQVNTILKMAKKRALVDAVLSAGRLSNVFTQDIEDMVENAVVPDDGFGQADDGPEGANSPYYCKKHQAWWFKKGKMRQFAHPITGTNPAEWCNMPDKQETTTVEPAPAATKAEEADAAMNAQEDAKEPVPVTRQEADPNAQATPQEWGRFMEMAGKKNIPTAKIVAKLEGKAMQERHPVKLIRDEAGAVDWMAVPKGLTSGDVAMLIKQAEMYQSRR